MFYVLFLDDNGRLHAKNSQFTDREGAQRYADGIAISRLPTVVEGPAVTRVCDNPHCYWYEGSKCGNTQEGRDDMGAECAHNW